jgi:hypothetical protein
MLRDAAARASAPRFLMPPAPLEIDDQQRSTRSSRCHHLATTTPERRGVGSLPPRPWSVGWSSPPSTTGHRWPPAIETLENAAPRRCSRPRLVDGRRCSGISRRTVGEVSPCRIARASSKTSPAPRSLEHLGIRRRVGRPSRVAQREAWRCRAPVPRLGRPQADPRRPPPPTTPGPQRSRGQGNRGLK